MYPLAYPLRWLIGAYAMVALIVVASLLPDVPGPALPGFDKLGHFLMYAAAAVWLTGIYRPRRWLFLLIALAVVGGGLELLQGAVSGRSASWGDALANFAGASGGLLAGWSLVPGWCRRLELLAGAGDRSSP